MSGRPSTIRTSNQPTLGDPLSANLSQSAVARIVEFWRDQAGQSVLLTCEAFPGLTSNRGLLLDLAVEEFKRKACDLGIDAREYCEQFRRFDSSLEHSIFRAIEVQEYLDCHPELMELVVNFRWPEPGESLQGFLVVEELGRGAIARVYLCRESGLGGREVVVKVARGNGYEAELLARLDHPNIVPVYSVVNDNDQFVTYICMPFRGRSTLQQLVSAIAHEIPTSSSAIFEAVAEEGHIRSRAGRNREPRGSYIDGIIRIASKLSDALSHAHRFGVLHGDLKPSNVLLTREVEPLLIDFNLARDQWSDTTPCGGTLAYMPPEILQGLIDGDTEANKYDVQSEVYSFGALLHELLAGEVPFPVQLEANATSVARQILELQRTIVPSLKQHNRAVNRGLESLVLECLSLDRRARPNSMEHVGRRIRQQNSLVLRIGRMFAAHPRVIKTATICSLAGVTLLALFLLLRPSYSARQFSQGMTLAGRGEYSSAIAAFGSAMGDEDRKSESLYQRGLAYLQVGKPAQAAKDFNRLYTVHKESRGAAFVGYCFNLQNEHSAAIMWYEKALAEGFDSAALQNDLGISYAICQSHVGHQERFEFAARHLHRALELDQGLMSARLNLMVLATVRGSQMNSAEVESTAHDADCLLEAYPDDQRVLYLTSRAFGALSRSDSRYLDRCIDVVSKATAADCGPSRTELMHSAAYTVLRQHFSYPKLLASASESPPTLSRGGIASFVPPLAIESAVRAEAGN